MENVCAAVYLPSGINRSLFRRQERERKREREMRRSRSSIIRMWSRYWLSILPVARLNIQSIDPFLCNSPRYPSPPISLSLSLPLCPFFVRLPPTAIPYSRLNFLLLISLSLSLCAPQTAVIANGNPNSR